MVCETASTTTGAEVGPVRMDPQITRHYATVARQRELPVLIASMRAHCAPFRLHALAWDFDPNGSRWLGEDVIVTQRETFLSDHPECAPEALPGPPRTANEVVCAVRWRFLLDVMMRTLAPVTLIDGDLWFWSSPEPMFTEIGAADVALSPHWFASASDGLPGATEESHGIFGRHNGGLSYWASLDAADRMAGLARECSRATDYLWPNGSVTWGDQGALGIILDEFKAHEIQHPGVNVAPWNYHRRRIENIGGIITADGHPLILVHYQSLRLNEGKVLQIADPGYEVSERIVQMLYAPYLEELKKWS